MADKPHLNMIVTGHIDNGKSTTMGHFLMDLGVVDERTIAAHAVESEKTGKGDTFKYAWVMDNIKDERERGITIDLAFQKFESAKYFFTLIDAPGHRDFIKNMITGASEADAAILVLSAKEGETDTAIAAGGQAREHAFLLKTLGVSQLIVAINKMDSVDYTEPKRGGRRPGRARGRGSGGPGVRSRSRWRLRQGRGTGRPGCRGCGRPWRGRVRVPRR